MLRKKMGGFTLIELMVVIVIIGVLASLAIPRFTEASMKAKVQDAPKVLASYETSYLAATAEVGTVTSDGELMFKIPSANWYAYTWIGTEFSGVSASGAKGVNLTLTSQYNKTENGFQRSSALGQNADTKLTNYVSNFVNAAQVRATATN